ncbi:hypothetical protein RB595_000426 [Gaeumannomyces hyphopodioides]
MEVAAVLVAGEVVVAVAKTCYFVYTELKAFENAPSDFKELADMVRRMEHGLERADAARSEARERHNSGAHDSLMHVQAVVTGLYNELGKKLNLTQTSEKLGSDRKKTVCWARVKVYINSDEYNDQRDRIFRCLPSAPSSH